ncbi:Low-affinity inorganic phosphate transporter 1 [Candidatus Providencia siddallii]|uniref:Phosphate transporter n=1 Tax=Candidatus Providencia siddallii TaxID=1715285 RepID=A0A0M6W710_9GAMM|nr:Low-affinity inorganic phosphate transporter 1 [Candidatus Providencia siddallii]
MLHFFANLEFHTCILIILAMLFVLFYEAINGFHDTANAVAIIIYTKAMRVRFAVIMSGIFNFFGVLLGGLSVAYTIVHLLPTDFLFNISFSRGVIMIFSLLLAAIIWNLGTWYFGIPASSSHTLIGATIGVGLTNAITKNTSIVEALNIQKIISVFMSLIISPIIGFTIALLMIFMFRYFWDGNKKPYSIHLTPDEREKKDSKSKPPFWIRTMLILSSIGVSFSHGANDGQKGIGLIMLMLICVAPSGFILKMNSNNSDINRTYNAIINMKHKYLTYDFILNNKIKNTLRQVENKKEFYSKFHCVNSNAMLILNKAQKLLTGIQSYYDLTIEERNTSRHLLMCLSDLSDSISELPEISNKDLNILKKFKVDFLLPIEYAPIWVIIGVALSLSIGTMFGWKRVAVTIGEKIGKKCITYGQGVSAQLTAAVSIGIASYTGMPVSTTQVLSSAVAGTMMIGSDGLQGKTIKNVILAWFLTLPVSIFLSSVLYWISMLIF